MVRALQNMYSVHFPQFSISLLAGLVGLCGLFQFSRELLPAENRVQDRVWVHAFVISMVSARYWPASDLRRKRTFVCRRLQGRIPVGTELGGTQLVLVLLAFVSTSGEYESLSRVDFRGLSLHKRCSHLKGWISLREGFLEGRWVTIVMDESRKPVKSGALCVRIAENQDPPY